MGLVELTNEVTFPATKLLWQRDFGLPSVSSISAIGGKCRSTDTVQNPNPTDLHNDLKRTVG